jgi:hypothetical protein
MVVSSSVEQSSRHFNLYCVKCSKYIGYVGIVTFKGLFSINPYSGEPIVQKEKKKKKTIKKKRKNRIIHETK